MGEDDRDRGVEDPMSVAGLGVVRHCLTVLMRGQVDIVAREGENTHWTMDLPGNAS